MIGIHPALCLPPPPLPLREGIPDLCPEIPVGRGGLSQSVMEAPGIGALYEHGVRPALTALVGGPSYATEAAWLQRWLSPSSVPAPAPILDLACGTGRYTRLLAAWHGVDRLIGLDLSWPMLRRARQQSPPDLCFARASAQALPLPDAVLAGACCMGALHLFPDPIAALAELGRVLLPGAPLVILTAVAPPNATNQLLQPLGRAIRLRFLDADRLDAGMRAARLVPRAQQRHGAMLLIAATALP